MSIDLLILCKSDKQIALALGASMHVVEFHLSNIYAKLDVTSRIEAALKLADTGLRGSIGDPLRESTVQKMDKPDDNGSTSISARRNPMHNSSFAKLVFLLLLVLICLLAMVMMAIQRESAQGIIYVSMLVSVAFFQVR